jgi:8-oxo-dGTP pyrophosphatase MutT (NUDIX family)
MSDRQVGAEKEIDPDMEMGAARETGAHDAPTEGRAGDPMPMPVVARDAATIMLVRDTPSGGAPSLEVCMVRRHLNSDFVGGAYVFPGGKVDDADRSPKAEDVCVGRTDAEASATLGISSGGLAFWIAALRECFEEAGVLLAYGEGDTSRRHLDLADGERHGRLQAMRAAVNAGTVAFVDACVHESVRLAIDRVHYFSHWITPEPAPKRYDTRFFVAALPPDQHPVHDDYETVDTVWVRPHDALARARAGEFDLIFPTMKNLEALGRAATTAELLTATAALKAVPTVLPRVVTDERGVRLLLPGDAGYDDAGIAVARAGRGRTMSASELSAAIRSIDADGRGQSA